MTVIYPTFLVILLTLSGCSTKEFKFGWYEPQKPSVVVVRKKVYPNIDDDFFICPDMAKPPPMTKQSQLSLYLVDLTVSGMRCKSNLNYVKILLTDFKTDTNTTKGLQDD